MVEMRAVLLTQLSIHNPKCAGVFEELTVEDILNAKQVTHQGVTHYLITVKSHKTSSTTASTTVTFSKDQQECLQGLVALVKSWRPCSKECMVVLPQGSRMVDKM